MKFKLLKMTVMSTLVLAGVSTQAASLRSNVLSNKSSEKDMSAIFVEMSQEECIQHFKDEIDAATEETERAEKAYNACLSRNRKDPAACLAQRADFLAAADQELALRNAQSQCIQDGGTWTDGQGEVAIRF